MHKPLPIDMATATRLTREGRLVEAMAILRGGAATPAAPASDNVPPRPTSGHAILDMQPPAPGSGGAWTAAGDAVRPPPAADARASAGSAWRGALRPRAKGGARPEVPAGASFESRTWSGPAGGRDYRVYVPATRRATPAPLLVMLHGCTQSADDFAVGTRMNALAEEHGFVVVYPQQSASANANGCWNWFAGGDQQRGRGEPALIAGITAHVVREFAIDPLQVHVAGLSAGGAAAAIMGAAYPDVYAAVGVHSGLAAGAASDMGSAFAAMRGGANGGPAIAATAVPTIVFHGDRDHTVGAINGEQVILQALAGADLAATTDTIRSADGRSSTRTVYRDGGRTLHEHWLVHGAGHAWSGGDHAGSYTDPRGPDASQEMVRFFLAHPRVAR